jgi:hypothetical protein
VIDEPALRARRNHGGFDAIRVASPRTAAGLIPPSILAQADEVIE